MSKTSKSLENNPAIGGTWEELKQEFLENGYLTAEELEASKIRVAVMGELIKAREKGGVKQPVISRMESLETNPQLDTLIKLLVPLGKTLAVVPLENK